MRYLYYITIALIFTLITPLLSAQNRITTKIAEFEEVYVKGRIDLELIHSSNTEMTIASREIDPNEVDVEFKNNTLQLKTKIKINSDQIVRIKLPYQKLSVVEASGGAVVNSAHRINSDVLQLKASSGGKIELNVQTQKIIAKVTQVSDIILYGKSENQEVIVNTGGNYLASDLNCKHTQIKATAGSQAKVTASESINATSNSKAFVGYIGDPGKTSVSTSLGGEIMQYRTKDDMNEPPHH